MDSSDRKASDVSEQFPQPLKADEIEALLRSAREFKSANHSDVVSNEPLGAGDVQHLWRTAPDDDSMTDHWTGDAVAAGREGSPLTETELDVTLVLGGAELTIEELLALREGSVVTLDKEADEPIDILVNGKLIARGEVIVVDEKYCVRICEVIGA